jgi:hypothetical protein
MRFSFRVIIALCFSLQWAGAKAQQAPEALYVVVGAQGAVARAILLGTAQCPAIVLDNMAQPMDLRAEADIGQQARFPVTSCEKLIPAGTASASVANISMPLPKSRLQTIAVLGDTGCRMKVAVAPARSGAANTDEGEEGKFQDCNNLSQWPFPAVSRAAAASKPDLVIHVGDYLYRESPCPPSDSGCAGSPFGDDWAAWKEDFFKPAKPLLLAAPWVMTRGNHEICKRGGSGYFRFLEPSLARGGIPPSCVEQIPPYTVTIAGKPFIVLDSSDAVDFAPTTADIARYAAQFSELRPAPGSWLVTHRPIWGVASKRSPSNGKRELVVLNQTLAGAVAASGSVLPTNVELVLSGHIHLWEAIGFGDKRPPQFVLGSGGTELAHAVKGQLAGLKIQNAFVSSGQSEHRWGFTNFSPAAAGAWTATFLDANGRGQMSCDVARGEVRCR